MLLLFLFCNMFGPHKYLSLRVRRHLRMFGTLIFYSMPTDLQLVVANCIGCFWALMCARIAAHSGVPTTDVHA